MVRHIARVVAAAALVVAAPVRGYTGAERERGAMAYVQHCAACHGPDGRGGPVPASFGALSRLLAPPVAGAGALRRFGSAAELAAFVKYDMPPQAPGTLSSQDALDLTAYLLSLAGLAPDGASLTLRAAARVTLVAPAPAPAPGRAR